MFSGSVVAIVTPMRTDGAVDFAAWERLLDFHLANGTNAVVVGGSTGESVSLRESELRELTQRACAHVNGRIPIIVGAGTSSTAITVERVRAMSELPIAGLLLVTPAYNRPTQEGLYRHFAAAVESTPHPVVLYNIPSRTAVDLLPATVARLAQLPRVVGVKEGVPQVSRVRELVAACPKDFLVLSGDDPTCREAVLAGAKGVISVTANVAPRGMSDMVAAALKGRAEEAERLDRPLTALHRSLCVEPNPIPVKWALARMGLMEGGLRLPLTELSSAHHSQLLSDLLAAGVMK
jgi:4-hydroxy-tetrahydrodipicolinate synthase